MQTLDITSPYVHFIYMIYLFSNTTVVMQVTILCAPNPIIFDDAVTTESKLY